MPAGNFLRKLFPYHQCRSQKIQKRSEKRRLTKMSLERLEDRMLPAVTLLGLPNWFDQGSKPMTGPVDGLSTSAPENPASGAVEAVAVDPNNAAHIFVGSVNGGIWVTNNGNRPFNGVDDDGINGVDDPFEQPDWTALTDDFASLAIGDLRFSPLDATGNTVFAGTGSASSLLNSGGTSIGVLRTTDGGTTWTLTPVNPSGSEPQIRAIQPTTFDADAGTAGVQQVILVGANSNNGLWRSSNGGNSYTLISGTGGLPTGPVTDILIDPNNASRFYVGVVGDGVFFSTDGGLNWNPTDNTDLTNVGTSTVVQLSAHPGGGSTVLYAHVGGPNPGVFTSTDGNNWAGLAALPAGFNSANNGLYTQAASDQMIVDPTNSQIVYVAKGYGGSPFMWRYNPAGAGSWVDIEEGGSAGATRPHVDNRDLQFVGNNVLISANDGGIYFMVNPQDATNNRWTSLHGRGVNGLGITENHDVAWDSTFFVATAANQDNGTTVQNGGFDPVWSRYLGADGGDVQVDTVNAGAGRTFRYASTQNFGSFNRHTFDSATNEPIAAVGLFPAGGLAGFTAPFVPAYELNRVAPARLVTGATGTNPIYELTNAATAPNAAGATWVAVPIGAGFGAVSGGFAVGGRLGGVDNPEVLVVGSGGNVFVRSTAGGTLTATATAFPGGNVQDIVLDPENWQHFFVTDGTGVWETTDAGAAIWNDLTGNLASVNSRLRSIDFVPSTAGGTLVAGGNLGVSRLSVGVTGAPWTRFGIGLPNALITDLEYNAASDVLLAGAYGRGAWTIFNVSAVIESPGVLEVCGDDLFPNQDDIFRIVRNQANPLLLEIYVNGALQFSGPMAAIQQINVWAAGGNDNLIVDSSNGLISIPNGIRYDGDRPCPEDHGNGGESNPGFNGGFTSSIGGFGGFDTLTLQQSLAGGPSIASDELAPAATPGGGRSLITDTDGNTQTVYFQYLEPVIDVVPSPTFDISAIPGLASLLQADNAINYSASQIIASGGRVTIDNFEPIEFSNKTTLIIDAGAGSDTINLSNPNTPTGLTGITVDGGDPGAFDTLVVTGTTAAETFEYQPTGTDSGTVLIPGPDAAFSLIELVVIDGRSFINDDTLIIRTEGGQDTVSLVPAANVDAGALHINATAGSEAPPSLTFRALGQDSFIELAASQGREDIFEYFGTASSDAFSVTATNGGTVDLNNRKEVRTPGIVSLILRGLDGDDTFSLASTLPYTSTTLDGGGPSASDVVSLTGATGPVNVNLADSSVIPATNTTITGYGGTVTLIGVEVANLDANTNAVTVTGTSQGDTITYTPTAAAAGTFSNAGLNTVFNISAATGNFTVFGGAGNNTDQVIVQGTEARDLIQISQGPATAQVFANNVTALLPVQLATNVEILTARGLGGVNTFQVIPSPGLGGGQDNLLINVDGGANGEFNALVIASSFGAAPATLPATSFVVINKNPTPNSGSIRVFQSAVANPDINYKNVQILSPNVANTVSGQGLNPNLLVMGADIYEPNFTQGTSAFLGSGATLQIQNASIFPNNAEFPGVPANQDWFRVVTQTTGTLDFQVYFRAFDVALLPGGGVLNIEVRDVNGNIVGSSTGAFGASNTSTAGSSLLNAARVRIPAVAGQSYFLHVFGVNGTVVNGYNATILNTAPPVPFNLELSRSVPPPIAGNPDTGSLPPNAPNHDSGRSQFDNVTSVNLPRIYIRLSDGILLNDLPGNGTPGSPPAGVIPIPFQGPGVAPPAGYRLAIFDGDNTQDPVGFATQVAGFPGLYQFTFTAPLVDGLHRITAAVQMVDPANPTQTGFGSVSVSLDIIVDTAPPPVFFGAAASATDGLDPATDSGVVGQPATFTDRITNVTTPEFFGTAEANAVVRLFVDLTGNGLTPDDIFLGETVAVPLDGTNAFPNGQWNLRTTVDLNNPAFFAHDGLRRILVTAEDLAGVVSTAQQLDIFIDTAGPQITNVQITGEPSFNLFAQKTENLVQGPTPLVHSLTISVRDLPPRVAQFLYNAFVESIAETPGGIILRGDNTGIIPITSIIANLNPPVAGQPATGTIELVFADPLPDDRYTLIIKDTAIIDPPGNKLDGESNAVEPFGFPTFPSGDGQPGGDFEARFTVNSRPHIGVYFSGTQFLDLNGNGVFDPVNKDNDQTNADHIFKFGLNTDANFAGNFVATGGVANGFSKLGAYGFVNGAYRWLLDLNGNTFQPTFSAISGVQFNGLPVAFRFNTALSGDQIGLFDGKGTWFIDFLGTNFMGPGTITINNGLTGFPIVGDFDGNGQFDLGTYRPDQKLFYFDLNPLGAPHVFTTFQFGFPAVISRPVAADMNQDGVTDIGAFEPALNGVASSDLVNWYFLVSDLETTPAIPGTINTLAHGFSPTPFGSDLHFTFGHNQDIPLVGLFDPPVLPAETSKATLSLFGSLYRDVLGRTPSESELADNWALAIVQGMTVEQAVSTIVNSTEAKAHSVVQYYQTYLHRLPGPNEIQGWVNILNAGGQAEDVLAGILGSGEYFAGQGGTAAGFVQGLYRDLLHRGASASEVNHWSAAAAVSRAGVVRDILRSAEYQSHLVNQLYANLLGRAASPGETATWVGNLQAGMTQTQLSIRMLTSDEYLTTGRHLSRPQPASTTPATLGLFRNLYQDVLGRTPSDAELTNNWASAIAHGMTVEQAVAVVTSSVEAKYRLVSQYYQKHLNRTPATNEVLGWVNIMNAGASAEDVLAAILASAEYKSGHGGTAAGFVQGLYQDLLQRTPSSAEVNHWIGAAAASPAAVVRDILNSSEAKTTQVNRLFQALLGRSAASDELAAWVGDSAFKLTENLTIRILSSEEYRDHHGL